MSIISYKSALSIKILGENIYPSITVLGQVLTNSLH